MTNLELLFETSSTFTNEPIQRRLPQKCLPMFVFFCSKNYCRPSHKIVHPFILKSIMSESGLDVTVIKYVKGLVQWESDVGYLPHFQCLHEMNTV